MENEQELILKQSYQEWRQDVNNALKAIRFHQYDIEELASSTERLLAITDKIAKTK